MLFRQEVLDGVRSGAVTLAFRRWRRPTVSTGSTLLTPVGQLVIRSVEVVALDEVTAADAARAGYASRAALVGDLERRAEGVVYRIELGPLRPVPRIGLRATVATEASQVDALRARLRRLDASAADGPGRRGRWPCCGAIRACAPATCATWWARRRRRSSSTCGS